MGSKSDVLDFSKYEQVEKILIVGARKVRKIILPQNDCVKALGISSMTNLESIENISIQKGMRYLHFDFGVKLPNFNFIRDLFDEKICINFIIAPVDTPHNIL